MLTSPYGNLDISIGIAVEYTDYPVEFWLDEIKEGYIFPTFPRTYTEDIATELIRIPLSALPSYAQKNYLTDYLSDIDFLQVDLIGTFERGGITALENIYSDLNIIRRVEEIRHNNSQSSLPIIKEYCVCQLESA